MLTGIPPLSETKDRGGSASSDFWTWCRLESGSEVPDALGTIVNKAMMLEVDRQKQTPARPCRPRRRPAARRVARRGAAGAGFRCGARRLAEVLDRTRKHEAVMVVELT